MGSNYRSKSEDLVNADRKAQRIAQGIRNYLVGLLAVGEISSVEVGYEAKTKGRKTTVRFLIVSHNPKIPFERLRTKMEFVHKKGK